MVEFNNILERKKGLFFWWKKQREKEEGKILFSRWDEQSIIKMIQEATDEEIKDRALRLFGNEKFSNKSPDNLLNNWSAMRPPLIRDHDTTSEAYQRGEAWSHGDEAASQKTHNPRL